MSDNTLGTPRKTYPPVQCAGEFAEVMTAERAEGKTHVVAANHYKVSIQLSIIAVLSVLFACYDMTVALAVTLAFFAPGAYRLFRHKLSPPNLRALTPHLQCCVCSCALSLILWVEPCLPHLLLLLGLLRRVYMSTPSFRTSVAKITGFIRFLLFMWVMLPCVLLFSILWPTLCCLLAVVNLIRAIGIREFLVRTVKTPAFRLALFVWTVHKLRLIPLLVEIAAFQVQPLLPITEPHYNQLRGWCKQCDKLQGGVFGKTYKTTSQKLTTLPARFSPYLLPTALPDVDCGRRAISAISIKYKKQMIVKPTDRGTTVETMRHYLDLLYSRNIKINLFIAFETGLVNDTHAKSGDAVVLHLLNGVPHWEFCVPATPAHVPKVPIPTSSTSSPPSGATPSTPVVVTPVVENPIALAVPMALSTAADPVLLTLQLSSGHLHSAAYHLLQTAYDTPDVDTLHSTAAIDDLRVEHLTPVIFKTPFTPTSTALVVYKPPYSLVPTRYAAIGYHKLPPWYYSGPLRPFNPLNVPQFGFWILTMADRAFRVSGMYWGVTGLALPYEFDFLIAPTPWKHKRFEYKHFRPLKTLAGVPVVGTGRQQCLCGPCAFGLCNCTFNSSVVMMGCGPTSHEEVARLCACALAHRVDLALLNPAFKPRPLHTEPVAKPVCPTYLLAPFVVNGLHIGFRQDGIFLKPTLSSTVTMTHNHLLLSAVAHLPALSTAAHANAARMALSLRNEKYDRRIDNMTVPIIHDAKVEFPTARLIAAHVDSLVNPLPQVYLFPPVGNTMLGSQPLSLWLVLVLNYKILMHTLLSAFGVPSAPLLTDITQQGDLHTLTLPDRSAPEVTLGRFGQLTAMLSAALYASTLYAFGPLFGFSKLYVTVSVAIDLNLNFWLSTLQPLQRRVVTKALASFVGMGYFALYGTGVISRRHAIKSALFHLGSLATSKSCDHLSHKMVNAFLSKAVSDYPVPYYDPVQLKGYAKRFGRVKSTGVAGECPQFCLKRCAGCGLYPQTKFKWVKSLCPSCYTSLTTVPDDGTWQTAYANLLPLQLPTGVYHLIRAIGIKSFEPVPKAKPVDPTFIIHEPKRPRQEKPPRVNNCLTGIGFLPRYTTIANTKAMQKTGLQFRVGLSTPKCQVSWMPLVSRFVHPVNLLPWYPASHAKSYINDLIDFGVVDYNQPCWLDLQRPERRQVFEQALTKLHQGCTSMEPVQAFIKTELTQAQMKNVHWSLEEGIARIIQCVCALAQVLLGIFIVAYQRAFESAHHTGKFQYAGGMTPTQLNAFAAKFYVPGKYLTSSYTYELDFSMFDSTIGPEIHQFLAEIYKQSGLTFTPLIQSAFNHVANPAGYTSYGYRYAGKTMNASGRVDTAVLNAIVNMAAQQVVFTAHYNSMTVEEVLMDPRIIDETPMDLICLGDDSITVYPFKIDKQFLTDSFAKLGLVAPDSKIQIHEDFRRCTFLGCRPWPSVIDGEDVACWGPTIGRRLPKMGFCVDLKISPQLWLRGTSLAYLTTCQHVPIIYDMAMKVFNLTTGPTVIADSLKPTHTTDTRLKMVSHYLPGFFELVYERSWSELMELRDLVQQVVTLPAVISHPIMDWLTVVDPG